MSGKRVYQCPGCYSSMRLEEIGPDRYYECETCGETPTCIDLREQDPAHRPRGPLTPEELAERCRAEGMTQDGVNELLAHMLATNDPPHPALSKEQRDRLGRIADRVDATVEEAEWPHDALAEQTDDAEFLRSLATEGETDEH